MAKFSIWEGFSLARSMDKPFLGGGVNSVSPFQCVFKETEWQYPPPPHFPSPFSPFPRPYDANNRLPSSKYIVPPSVWVSDSSEWRDRLGKKRHFRSTRLCQAKADTSSYFPSILFSILYSRLELLQIEGNIGNLNREMWEIFLHRRNRRLFFTCSADPGQ